MRLIELKYFQQTRHLLKGTGLILLLGQMDLDISVVFRDVSEQNGIREKLHTNKQFRGNLNYNRVHWANLNALSEYRSLILFSVL